MYMQWSVVMYFLMRDSDSSDMPDEASPRKLLIREDQSTLEFIWISANPFVENCVSKK